MQKNKLSRKVNIYDSGKVQFRISLQINHLQLCKKITVIPKNQDYRQLTTFPQLLLTY